LKGKHVLITGHTGFKGSWLIAMLHHQGARVSGIALDPVKGGIFEKASLHELLVHDIRLDIRDSDGLKKAFQTIAPDVVIHLAAQPLVLTSYEKPSETYETNVMGTLNVLQAVDATSSVEVTLIVTTDKVYSQAAGATKAFVETDALGAADPYSTSKAMADLLTQSWIASHPESRIAIARAGNVIGGGDVAENRLLPDLINSFAEGKQGVVRNPESVRPWQHVLDCLYGYLRLLEALRQDPMARSAFNFSPPTVNPQTVSQVAVIAAKTWGVGASWAPQSGSGVPPPESRYLTLDSEKAQKVLGWKSLLDVRLAVEWSVGWNQEVIQGKDAKEVTLEQVDAFYGLLENG
jgi:CDP-glucose 4,6-dehydratase